MELVSHFQGQFQAPLKNFCVLMIDGGKGQLGVWEGHVLTAVFKWTASRTHCSTGDSAQCSVVAWMGGRHEEEWIHAHIWLSPFTVYLKPLQHC